MSERSIVDIVASHAQRGGERTAVLCADTGCSFSYAALNEMSARSRGMFRALGLEPGGRVALVMCDGPEWITALLGVIGISGIAVPCSTMLCAVELGAMLSDCGARIAVVTADQCAKLEAALSQTPALKTVLVAGSGQLETNALQVLNFQEALAAASPAPPANFDGGTAAIILYSSGSTGAPKGAVHRHCDVPFTIAAVGREVLQVRSEDRLFSSSRLFFAYGFGNSLSFPLGLGATSVLCGERPTPPVIAQVFAQHRPTIFFAVPATYRALLEHKRQGNALDTRSLRFCVSAGESLPARLYYEWLDATGTTILDGIGSTELLHQFIMNRKDRIRPGSSGVPIAGYDLRLLDDDGTPVIGPGDGHLFVKGESAFSHYWKQPEKTAEVLCEGWVKTGDIYHRDEDGFYWHAGRSDDVFKSKGMWVSPVEIEEALCASGIVSEAAVVAELDADRANLVAAHVVLCAGAVPAPETRERIKQEMAALLPRYKRPERIYFMQALPRTATGKLQRFKLRESSGCPSGQ